MVVFQFLLACGTGRPCGPPLDGQCRKDTSVVSAKQRTVPQKSRAVTERPEIWSWKSFKLSGGLEHQFYFPINIGLLIIPIDFHIFQRGGPTTNQKLSEA